MNDAKRLSLGERQFLEFAFALIGFGLTVRRARHLVVCMIRAGGDMAQTIIGTGRAEELHRAQCEQEEKQTLCECTDHDALPLRKWHHSTMMSTRFAISLGPAAKPQ